MAQHRADLTHGPEIADPSFNLVQLVGTLRLRQRNNNGQWAPYGKFGTGNYLLDTWSPQAPIQITGFIAEATVVGEDQLLFRLSPDGGTTPLWWNGAAWATATDPNVHWNTEDQVDAHIAVFPLGTGISQIVRFVSADGTTTPILNGTSIYYEVQYEPTVDLLDSLARRISDGLRVQGVFQVQVPIPTMPPAPPAVPSNTVTIDDPLWVVNDPIQVFNDTVDPQRRNNLYVSRVGDVLTLSAVQTGLLTVRYAGSLALTRIHIATDADVELAELPAVVLQTPSSNRVRYENTFDDYEELLRSLNVVRRRKSATFEEIRVLIQCNAAWDLHGRKLRDGMRAFIEEEVETLQSLALDEKLVRTMIGPMSAAHDLPEQTAMFEMPAIFSVLNWPNAHSDAAIAQTIGLNTWPVSEIAPDFSQPGAVFEPVESTEITGGSLPTSSTLDTIQDEIDALQADVAALQDGGAGGSGAAVRPYSAGVALRSVVYQKSDGTVDLASAASIGLGIPIGVVSHMDFPATGQCQITFAGDVSGFSGLVPGAIYILGLTPGSIVGETDVGNPNYPNTTPGSGNILAEVGIAGSAGTLLVETLRDFEEL